MVALLISLHAHRLTPRPASKNERHPGVLELTKVVFCRKEDTMDLLQWAITTIVGILGIMAGRVWGRHDRIAQKDKEIYAKILELLPHDNLLFFKQHDFQDLLEDCR